ncbi:MAG: GGDEF domain-containing protein [Epsilonproteobacteria bacterium]|nr:GGDEF domain-containing protein [Campylobacterota bacterium]
MIQKHFFSTYSNRFFIFFVVLGVFLYGGWRLLESHEKIKSIAKDEMVMLYKIVLKLSHPNIFHSVSIENEAYESQKEFFDEYQKITPYALAQASHEKLPFALTLHFFTKESLPAELQGDLKALEKSPYVYKQIPFHITLLGKVGEDGYLFIQKEARNLESLLRVIRDRVWEMGFILCMTLGALLFAYYEAWTYHRKKESMEAEYLYLEEDAKKLAFVDTLTGVASRLKLSQSLDDLIENAKRFSQPFSLILCDLDHFKRINDTYGHDYGDEVLQSVAKVLEHNLRKSDIIARWGGEEFILLLPMAHLKSAIKTADKLRRSICVSSSDTLAYVTCSFGVVEYQIGEDTQRLFKRVDTLLYEAKKAGRNCIKYEKKG